MNGERWPAKYDVLGVQVSATTYDEAIDAIVGAVRRNEPAVATFHAVHALVTASSDPQLRRQVNSFQLLAPDGQPVRWALNWLHGARLRERVYGPELMWRLCRRAESDGIPIYLYGGSPDTLVALKDRLQTAFPNLAIVGAESPPFRPLTPDEDAATVERINASGAGLVFIGLGAPKQDFFAHDHARSIRGVQLCVGAAFDFHAGAKRIAPSWMQRSGLEWLFRLCQEPRRLWRRYLVTNTQ
ncbi:MAG TPA: WecB/TagA/CpsF family glycosyltransferase, partial [Pirellulaceae bacterium]|nr:WecB/TagA/CpsF family glycosyltransferase [Pirellulaceae bacterium]